MSSPLALQRSLGQLQVGVYASPAYLARPGVPAHPGALVRLFADCQIAPMPLTLAYSPTRHVNASLRVFIDWVLMQQHAPLAGTGR